MALFSTIYFERSNENDLSRLATNSFRDLTRSHFYLARCSVIDIRGEISESAPVPILGVGVRQGGNLVTGELNVSPGTPLQMEIFLDNGSAPVYGLLVTYMLVTDTKSQEETIIINGWAFIPMDNIYRSNWTTVFDQHRESRLIRIIICAASCSVDPYLFENFNTVDGDFLTAKFRAFKFPESTYVQFRGTVNVCLDKCQGVCQCWRVTRVASLSEACSNNRPARCLRRYLRRHVVSDRVQQWPNWIREEEEGHRCLEYRQEQALRGDHVRSYQSRLRGGRGDR